MILYIKDHKDSTKKVLHLINTFIKIVRYNINAQKTIAFLHMNDNHTEKEIRDTIPFTIASKNILE